MRIRKIVEEYTERYTQQHVKLRLVSFLKPLSSAFSNGVTEAVATNVNSTLNGARLNCNERKRTGDYSLAHVRHYNVRRRYSLRRNFAIHSSAQHLVVGLQNLFGDNARVVA